VSRRGAGAQPTGRDVSALIKAFRDRGLTPRLEFAPAFRGIAASVTAALTETMFAQGAQSVWLQYSGDGSRRVYERVGYQPQGTRLNMALEG
jgi:hypothetical protein